MSRRFGASFRIRGRRLLSTTSNTPGGRATRTARALPGGPVAEELEICPSIDVELLPNQDWNSREECRFPPHIANIHAVRGVEAFSLVESSRGRATRSRQRELDFRSWGGARRGAGRKPLGSRPRVPHSERPAHRSSDPIHVTLRLRELLPSLRCGAAFREVECAFASLRDRCDLRLTHFSLQSNHIHLIAEADSRHELSRGIQGLVIRIARGLNRLWSRRGPVFSDRYHARALRTPSEVRSALLYVLHNAKHHGLRVPRIDPYSSSRWFDGWKELSPTVEDTPVSPARSWLLGVGWTRHGLLRMDESPRSARRRSQPEKRGRRRGSPRPRLEKELGVPSRSSRPRTSRPARGV